MLDLATGGANAVSSSRGHLPNRSGANAGNNAGGVKPNFFVFQNKMSSRPSLHNFHQQVNGFGNAHRTARNAGSANKYQLVGSTPVGGAAASAPRVSTGASAARKTAWNASTKTALGGASQPHGINLFGNQRKAALQGSEPRSAPKRGLSGMHAGQTKPQGAFAQYATQAERIQSAAPKQHLNQSATHFYGQQSRDLRNQRALNSGGAGDRSHSNDPSAVATALSKHRSQTGTLYGIVSNKKKELVQKGMATPTLQSRASNGG